MCPRRRPLPAAVLHREAEPERRHRQCGEATQGHCCEQPGQQQAAAAQQWTFDSVWDGTTVQADLYADVCTPIVKSVLEGYNGTIFAYGQTGQSRAAPTP